MKDEEFENKLELILKTLYDIDKEVKKYLDEKKPTMKYESILDNKYKT